MFHSFYGLAIRIGGNVYDIRIVFRSKGSGGGTSSLRRTGRASVIAIDVLSLLPET
jgi:hypothetical protein